MGGGTHAQGVCGHLQTISIHPPRGGWDCHAFTSLQPFIISIHPPRGGWDLNCDWRFTEPFYFNPPTPWGVGPSLDDGSHGDVGFQSTHPVGGGTSGSSLQGRVGVISIHPPRGGWDSTPRHGAANGTHFNPPTPWGVGRHGLPLREQRYYFNPPTPWGVGPIVSGSAGAGAVFQSTHPVGGGTITENNETTRI